MDPDMNKYDVEHVVTAHPKMSAEEWSGIYQAAWGHYYTDEHLETIMRRAYACGINLRSLRTVLFWFSSAVPVEGLHPLQWGIFRIKHRRDRRSGLPIESPIVFYAKYAADIARKVTIVARRWRHLTRILNKVEADPDAKLYMDEALTAVAEEDAEHMELYTQNVAARTAVERERRVAAKPANGRSAVLIGNGRNGAGAAVANGNGNGHDANGHDDAHHDHHGHDRDDPRPISPLV
jgi:hypothetical protein